MSSFVRSERSGASLSIYGFTRPVLGAYSRGVGPSPPTARRVDGTDGLELVTLSCVTSMGAGSGWQATLKYPATFDPMEEIELGAWVYVSFLRDGVEYVTCIGRLTQRSIQEASAGGATTRSCFLGGGGFELVWKQTKWWFNVLRRSTPENATNALIKQVGNEYLLGSPRDNVDAILTKYLAIMGSFDRAPYALPYTMPASGDTVLAALVLDDSGYDATTLPVTQPIASAAYPNVDLWSLAQEYQDGMFTELLADVLPAGGIAAYAQSPDMAAGLPPQKAEMTLVFRDKPFPLVSAGLGTRRGRASPYFSLPTHYIDRADIPTLSFAASEEETFNTFSFANVGSQEGVRSAIEAQYVQWNTDLLREQGLLKLDATSMYYSNDLTRQYDYNRKRVRDWYCLGRLQFSGSVMLARGYPQIKVGSRVVIRGDTPAENVTLYVESVRHMWRAGGGMQTTLDVTRGYRGTDAQHLARLESEAREYSDSF